MPKKPLLLSLSFDLMNLIVKDLPVESRIDLKNSCAELYSKIGTKQFCDTSQESHLFIDPVIMHPDNYISAMAHYSREKNGHIICCLIKHVGVDDACNKKRLEIVNYYDTALNDLNNIKINTLIFGLGDSECHLLRAMEDEQPAVFQLLLKSNHGISTKMADYPGETLFHKAAYNPDIRYLQCLLKHKYIDVNDCSRAGNTALALAMIHRRLESFEALLDHKSINPNVQDGEGYTCLHKAVMGSNLVFIDLLLKHQGIDMYIKNRHGLSSFDMACMSDDKKELALFYNKMTFFEKNRAVLIQNGIIGIAAIIMLYGTCYTY